MQPKANQVWGDPKRPETWRYFYWPFSNQPSDGIYFEWGRIPEHYNTFDSKFIRKADAARWAADNGFVDITEIVRGAAG